MVDALIKAGHVADRQEAFDRFRFGYGRQVHKVLVFPPGHTDELVGGGREFIQDLLEALSRVAVVREHLNAPEIHLSVGRCQFSNLDG